MERFQLITEQSPWLVLLCFLIGALYAWALYQKKAPWSPWLNRGLAVLRFVLVTVICLLLLLDPLIRQVINTEEKPTIVLALDNSQSIPNVNDSSQIKKLLGELASVSKELTSNDINVEIQSLDQTGFNKSLPDLNYDRPSTNLSAILKTIQNNFENRNLDKVVLVSDGIHNQGISPNFVNYTFPIHTVALGDTTPQRDLRVQSVLANKVAYLGNEFPVVAELNHVGYSNRVVNAYLSQNGRVIDQKSVRFQGDNDIQQVTFYANAKQKGVQHYVVSVEVLEGEFTEKNNSRDVYVEVIDGKEKILMIAAAPHPDIKAIRSVVEQNENYSFVVHIPGINPLKEDKYDLVIFHQIPSLYRTGDELINRFRNVSRWFILGAQSNLNRFNQISKNLKVSGRAGRMDKVTPVYAKNFNKFTFEGDKKTMIEKLPPVSVHFADYNVSNNAEVILSQRVGNIETEKPLLVVSQDGNLKNAVMTGEGFWQWRLEEYALSDSHESFDDLMAKLIQYLSTKEDKRRLRVYPINNEFYDFEKVVFESEVYNNIYERVYGQKINLTLTNEEGKTSNYTFTSNEGNTRYEISGLPKGVYSYQATAQLQGGAESVSGEFTIKDLQLESLNYTADHNLLRQLSENSGGDFYYPTQVENLRKDLLDNRKPNIIHSTEELAELINLKWIFFILLALVGVEWATRKYQGGY